MKMDTTKASQEKIGGLSNFENSRGDLIERGLITEGDLFTKSNDKDIFDSCSVLLPHILRIKRTIFSSQIDNFDTVLSQIISK